LQKLAKQGSVSKSSIQDGWTLYDKCTSNAQGTVGGISGVDEKVFYQGKEDNGAIEKGGISYVEWTEYSGRA